MEPPATHRRTEALQTRLEELDRLAAVSARIAGHLAAIAMLLLVVFQMARGETPGIDLIQALRGK